jgi:hypothetical protein
MGKVYLAIVSDILVFLCMIGPKIHDLLLENGCFDLANFEVVGGG